MAFKCNTAQTDPWTSEINGANDGTINIDPEDKKGRFRGKHRKGQSQDITGRCHPDGIWFLLPDVKPQFLYSGVFTTENQIEGFRITLGATAAAAEDDWVATRGPTLTGKSGQKTSSK